jgi:hypothetical protein
MDASEELNQSATGTGQRRLHACPFLQDSAETHERATANCLLIFRAEQIERDVRHEVDKGGEGVRKGDHNHNILEMSSVRFVQMQCVM